MRGQTRKGSRRAQRVRNTPESGSRRDAQPLPSRAMCCHFGNSTNSDGDQPPKGETLTSLAATRAAHSGIQRVGLMPMKFARCASIRAEVRPEHNPVPRIISSSLASCFEHCRLKRLARARASPGYKLERRVVLLACVECSR
jgi:hypothetical protein